MASAAAWYASDSSVSSSSRARHRASSSARHCGPSRTGVVVAVLRSWLGIMLLRVEVLPISAAGGRAGPVKPLW